MHKSRKLHAPRRAPPPRPSGCLPAARPGQGLSLAGQGRPSCRVHQRRGRRPDAWRASSALEAAGRLRVITDTPYSFVTTVSSKKGVERILRSRAPIEPEAVILAHRDLLPSTPSRSASTGHLLPLPRICRAVHAHPALSPRCPRWSTATASASGSAPRSACASPPTRCAPRCSSSSTSRCRSAASSPCGAVCSLFGARPPRSATRGAGASTSSSTRAAAARRLDRLRPARRRQPELVREGRGRPSCSERLRSEGTRGHFFTAPATFFTSQPTACTGVT